MLLESCRLSIWTPQKQLQRMVGSDSKGQGHIPPASSNASCKTWPCGRLLDEYCKKETKICSVFEAYT